MRKSEFRVVDLEINECAGRALLPDEETGLLRADRSLTGGPHGTGLANWQGFLDWGIMICDIRRRMPIS